MLRYCSLLFLALLFAGCNVNSALTTPESEGLSHLLQRTGKEIPPQEADRLTKDIYHKTAALAREFDLVSPPQLHNFLVNVGLRERGLCYHFSDALYLHLKSRDYKSFDFHLVGANIGEYWSEHNALLVVAKGCTSEKCMRQKGVIVDAWRNSGELYYVKMNQDKSYEWRHRSERCEH